MGLEPGSLEKASAAFPSMEGNKQDILGKRIPTQCRNKLDRNQVTEERFQVKKSTSESGDE